MRALRVSPLMRRASPLNYDAGAALGGTLKEIALGLSELSSGLENRGNTIVGPRTSTTSGSPSSQKARSRAGPAVGTVSTLPDASTPTRKRMKARESASIQTQRDASDADWAHAQLQQMWDDGELSPRAPLDRSLGYFSSASPVSVGRSQPGDAADETEAEDNLAQKHDRSQQCLGAPLFISDVRALRQMAPFSSTEEQVLTRSQRRRSSANLLQQLVAAQPREYAETRLQQQHQNPAYEQRTEDILTKDHAVQCVAAGSARQHQQQRLDEQLQSTRVLNLALDMTSAASAVTCGLGSRKRRASSPLASSCTSALGKTETLKGVGQCITTEVSGTKGRRRLPPASAAAEKAAIAGTTLGPSQSSPGRDPTSATEVASSSSFVERGNSSNSSSSKIESPFHKLPPPSPSDFPVASPPPGSSPINTSCRSPRLTATKQLKQERQVPIVTVSGQRPSRASTGAKHEQPCPESPLRTSPRLSRGSRASACPTFQTPGSPCYPVHTSEAAGSNLPQRKDHRRSMSPLAKAFGCTRSRRATQQQCSGDVESVVATGPPLAAPPAHESVAVPPAVEQQKLSGARFATSQPASAAAVSKGKSARTQDDQPSTAEMSGNDVTPAAGGTTSQSVKGKEIPSPARSGGFSSSQQKPVSPAAAAAPTAASAHRHQCRRRILPAVSPTVKSRPQAIISAESTLPDKNSSRRETKYSANAPSAIPAGGRRRSTSRRACGLTVTSIPFVCEASSSGSRKTCVPSSLTALRKAAGGAGTQTAAQTPPTVPSRRRSTTFTKSRPTRAAPTQSSMSSNPAAERTSQAKGADTTSAQVEKCESEAPPTAAVATAKRDFSALATARRRPGLEATCRLSAARCLGGSNSNLQQRPAKALTTPRKVHAPPINKPRAEISARGMKENHGSTVAKSRISPSRQPVERPRCLFLGSPLTRSSRKSSAAPTTAVARRSALAQGAFKRRAKPSMQPSKDTDDSRSEPAHDSSGTGNAGQAEIRVAESVKDSVSLPEDSLSHAERLAASTGSKAASEDSAHSRANLHANDESSGGNACNSSSSCCTDNSCVSDGLQGAPSPLDASLHFTDVEGACALAQRECHNKSLSQGRRRSSSPHSISLFKGVGSRGAENQQVEGSSRSMRRASSECSLNFGAQRRVSEQQQEFDALEEWEGRDREYQEKQQNLLLEQQRKERLLAWEQREAELLRNRKALSQEEPSFWGFDPFMVDEEDEGVLSTEELRVEVSRFLKGDLRFHSRADLLRVVKKFSEQTRTTTTTTSSRLNFAKVEQRVVPMAARQVHGPVPQERRRKSILRSSNGASHSECRRRSRGISFSPFNKVQLYMLDEHERASKEAAANLSQQGEQRQQLRQRLAQQFQLMLLRGDSDSELALLRRELAELYDPDEEEDLAFLSPTLAPDRGAQAGNQGTSPGLSQQKQSEGLKSNNIETAEPFAAAGTKAESRLPFTVSPSWRQRQHGSSQETLGASKAEPSAEWTTPPSPFEPNRFNKSGGKDNEDCWGTYLETQECAHGGERAGGAFGNDENANCNAAGVPPSHPRSEFEKPQRPSRGVSSEDISRIHGKETARRPSVLSRRLSVVPNVHSSCLRHPSLDVVLTPHQTF